MKHETVVLVVDSQEVFEHMAPIIAEELKTTHILHRDSEEGALEVLRSHQPLDMIFADWEVAGPYFIAAVRNDPETHFTPLIVMSSTDRDDVIADAMRAGASDHMAKPFLPKGLVARIRRITKNQERRRQRRVRPQDAYKVTATIDGLAPLDLAMVDIALGGCQTRAPLSLCRDVCIYQEAELAISHADEVITLAGRVMRMAKDPTSPDPGNTILLAFEFTGVDDSRDELSDLLDHLREQWGAGESSSTDE